MPIGVSKNYTEEMKEDIDFIIEVLADDTDEGISTILNYFQNNNERWFGKSADQSGNDWALEGSLTPFRSISGSADFGSDTNDEAKVFGIDDTPVIEGESNFNLMRLNVYQASVTTPYILRIIWGKTTMAQSIADEQYSTLEVSFDNFAGVPFQIAFPEILVGNKVWVQCKNATDNATFDFFVGIRGLTS
jgi:hypothetical protein